MKILCESMTLKYISLSGFHSMLKVNRTVIPIASFISGALIVGLSSIYLIILSLLSAFISVYKNKRITVEIKDEDLKKGFVSMNFIIKEQS